MGGAFKETGYKAIILKRQAGVARVTMNRPEKMNGVDQEMCKELIAATEEVVQAPEVKVAILTGSGKAFKAALGV